MELLVWSVVGAVTCGVIASAKNRNVLGWIVLGALFCVVSIVILLLLPDLSRVSSGHKTETYSGNVSSNESENSRIEQLQQDKSGTGTAASSYENIHYKSNLLLFQSEESMQIHVNDLLSRVKMKENDFGRFPLTPWNYAAWLEEFQSALSMGRLQEAENKGVDIVARCTCYYDKKFSNLHRHDHLAFIGSKFLRDMRHPVALKWLKAAETIRYWPTPDMSHAEQHKWALDKFILYNNLWELWFDLLSFPSKNYKFPYSDIDARNLRKIAKLYSDKYQRLSGIEDRRYEKLKKYADEINNHSYGYLGD